MGPPYCWAAQDASSLPPAMARPACRKVGWKAPTDCIVRGSCGGCHGRARDISTQLRQPSLTSGVVGVDVVALQVTQLDELVHTAAQQRRLRGWRGGRGAAQHRRSTEARAGGVCWLHMITLVSSRSGFAAEPQDRGQGQRRRQRRRRVRVAAVPAVQPSALRTRLTCSRKATK